MESNNLIPATNTCTCASSFEIHVNVSPESSSQSSVHVYKKSLQSGKDSAKENPKLKARKKKIKDLIVDGKIPDIGCVGVTGQWDNRV